MRFVEKLSENGGKGVKGELHSKRGGQNSSGGWSIHGLKFSVPRTDFSLLDLIEFNMPCMAVCVIHHFKMSLITDIS